MVNHPKKTKKRKGFISFLTRFPIIELPVVLDPNETLEFSRRNKPLPLELARDFLYQDEPDEIQEFTEFIAGFKIPDTGKFHSLVFWKGDLLRYSFVLATFTFEGNLVAKFELAGTKVHEEVLEVSVAVVQTNQLIEVFSGSVSSLEHTIPEEVFEPAYQLKLDHETGSVIQN